MLSLVRCRTLWLLQCNSVVHRDMVGSMIVGHSWCSLPSVWLHLHQTTNRLIRPHGGSNIADSRLRPAAMNSDKWFGKGAYGTRGVDFEILRHDDGEVRTRLYIDDQKTAHDCRPGFYLTQHPFAHLHSRCEPYSSLTFLAFYRCGSSVREALSHPHTLAVSAETWPTSTAHQHAPGITSTARVKCSVVLLICILVSRRQPPHGVGNGRNPTECNYSILSMSITEILTIVSAVRASSINVQGSWEKYRTLLRLTFLNSTRLPPSLQSVLEPQLHFLSRSTTELYLIATIANHPYTQLHHSEAMAE